MCVCVCWVQGGGGESSFFSFVIFDGCYFLGPYRLVDARSRLTSEAKHGWAWLVPVWETTGKHQEACPLVARSNKPSFHGLTTCGRSHKGLVHCDTGSLDCCPHDPEENGCMYLIFYMMYFIWCEALCKLCFVYYYYYYWSNNAEGSTVQWPLSSGVSYFISSVSLDYVTMLFPPVVCSLLLCPLSHSLLGSASVLEQAVDPQLFWMIFSGLFTRNTIWNTSK